MKERKSSRQTTVGWQKCPLYFLWEDLYSKLWRCSGALEAGEEGVIDLVSRLQEPNLLPTESNVPLKGHYFQ